MYQLMLKLFVKDYDNVTDQNVRQRYGLLSGVVGILCNLLLFALKMTVGLLIGSMAVVSDAFNNLSDMGSTVISMAGIKLSNRKPDPDHPFGHGRFEYVAALIVSFLIMLVGFELLKTAVDKIIHPEEAAPLNWLLVGLLALSLPVKLFMFGYNRYFGKKIDSAPLTATALDSRNDCIATGAVILSTIIDGLHFLPFVIDGFVSALVSLLIMWAGFSMAKETVDLLLGQPPEEETVHATKEQLLATPGVLDIHDLIIHNYGPGRLYASVHVEIPDDADIVEVHEHIDEAEKRIFHELGCMITIHMDPVSVNNPILESVKARLKELTAEKGYLFHDVRMTDGQDHINIIFDLLVPFGLNAKEEAASVQAIKDGIRALDNRYSVVITVDHDYNNML